MTNIFPSSSLLNQIDGFIHHSIRGQEGKSCAKFWLTSRKKISKKEMHFNKNHLNYGLFLLGWKAGLRVSEAIRFDYQLKHPKYKDLYLVRGKGQKERYVYVSPLTISELKKYHWQPNSLSRISFFNFLKSVKEKMNIPDVELTPHTLRRAFTTHNALNGVPLPILQKALGHVNIRTTSCYWKGSVDIRKFSEWLTPNYDLQQAPDKVLPVKIDDLYQPLKHLKIPVKLTKISPWVNSKEQEYLKTIAKLKGELEQKKMVIKERAKEINLINSQNRILRSQVANLNSCLVSRKQELAHANQKLTEYQESWQNWDGKLGKTRQKLSPKTQENKLLTPNCSSGKTSSKSLNKLAKRSDKKFLAEPKNDKLLAVQSTEQVHQELKEESVVQIPVNLWKLKSSN